MTPMMQADEMAQAFNACTARENWKAVTGGTRTAPTVIFKSRSAMVELTYYTEGQAFCVAFTRATCAFGDFMGAAHRSLLTVLTALKAAGQPVAAPMELDDGVLRIQWNPKLKEAYVSLAGLEDDWKEYAPAPFNASLPGEYRQRLVEKDVVGERDVLMAAAWEGSEEQKEYDASRYRK